VSVKVSGWATTYPTMLSHFHDWRCPWDELFNKSCASLTIKFSSVAYLIALKILLWLWNSEAFHLQKYPLSVLKLSSLIDPIHWIFRFKCKWDIQWMQLTCNVFLREILYLNPTKVLSIYKLTINFTSCLSTIHINILNY